MTLRIELFSFFILSYLVNSEQLIFIVNHTISKNWSKQEKITIKSPLFYGKTHNISFLI